MGDWLLVCAGRFLRALIDVSVGLGSMSSSFSLLLVSKSIVSVVPFVARERLVLDF